MKTTFRKTAQRGFTLIELIITIVIIGVLAAVAIPKFLDLTNDAEKGVAAGVAAAIASGTSVNYGRSKVPGAAPCTVAGVPNAPAGCYFTITTCAEIDAWRAALADIPAGYAVAGTSVPNPIVANGAAVPGCTVTKGGISVGFTAYGA
jgi:prepilin-type N-terminal cleavage/methylation domain-containing protein